MKPADMVRETPYIKPGDDVPNIGSNQQFDAAIAPLNNPNDVGDRTGVKGGFAIPMFVDKKEPRIPDYDEVKDKIAQSAKQQRAKEQLDQKARDFAASVTSAADLKAAAEKAGLEVATEEAYAADRALGKVGTSTALDEVLYGLKEGEATKAPVKVGDSWVIAGVTRRKEADLSLFAGKRAQLTETALKNRQDQIYEDYIASAVARLRREGKIKIYQDVLDTLDEDEPQVAPQAPPRRPRVPVNIK
jgi:peptidyl-prolyl cis-trans isomerase D